MERRVYSAGAVKLSFWFPEFRKVVQLLAAGSSFDEIRRESQEENIFGAPTQRRSDQICRTVLTRVQALDSSFYPVFLGGDLATQKLFALAAVMACDTLFFDFVYEVIREKLIIGSLELEPKDVRVFFRDKQAQDDRLAQWTDQTYQRLGTCYRTMLYEAGLTDKAKETRKIFKPILETALRQWLEAHDMGLIIKAWTGVK
jgi:hypothetical protein